MKTPMKMKPFNLSPSLQRCVPRVCIGSLLIVLLLTRAAAVGSIVDTTIGTGIGTSVPDVFGDGSNVRVQTSIVSVTYESPVLVKRDGLNYREVLGTVKGIAWGGEFQNLSGPLLPPPEVDFSQCIPSSRSRRVCFSSAAILTTAMSGMCATPAG